GPAREILREIQLASVPDTDVQEGVTDEVYGSALEGVGESRGGGPRRQRAVVDRAEPVRADDEHGEPDLRGQVRIRRRVPDGHENAARTLDEQDVGRGRTSEDVLREAVDVDRPSLEACRDGRRQRRAQAVRADVVERRRVLGGGAEPECVLRLARDTRLDGLHHGDAESPRPQRAGERARDESLPDAGVGAGDEETAHAAVTSAIASRATSTSWSSSAAAIARGGIRTIVLPRGRRITPRARAARTARWPMRAAAG